MTQTPYRTERLKSMSDPSNDAESSHEEELDDVGSLNVNYNNYNFDMESNSKASKRLSIGTLSGANSMIRPERDNTDDPDNPHFYSAKKYFDTNSHNKYELASTKDAKTENEVGEEKQVAGQDMSDISETSHLNHSNEPNLHPSLYFPQNKRASSDSAFSILRNRRKKTIQKINELTENTKHRRVFGAWQLYCYVITFWAPSFLMKMCGMKEQSRRMAWREKIALISLIIYCGAFVAFLTFGFSRTVCHVGASPRLRFNEVDSNHVVINGKAFDLSTISHPSISNDANSMSNPLVDAGGKDISFLFQNVNGNCKNLIMPRTNCSIPFDNNNSIAWYFPCKIRHINGSSLPDFSEPDGYSGYGCHTSTLSRKAYYDLKEVADVYYTWDDLVTSAANLVVLDGNVLDLNLLNWLEQFDLLTPPEFEYLQNYKFQGYDLSMILSNYARDQKISHCLIDIAKVGIIDSQSVGCITSQVVLYISLIFILSIVFAKFFVACYFRWIVSRKQGVSEMGVKNFDKLSNDIEDWSNDLNSPGPIRNETQATNGIVDPQGSVDYKKISECSYTTMTTQAVLKQRKLDTALKNASTINSSVAAKETKTGEDTWPSETLNPKWISGNAITQPRPDYMPFGFPLIHTICFVTCYSEDEIGLRTTFDSLCVTDYPSSHKLIMCVCDGLIKGSGNTETTPEIVLKMMEDFIIEPGLAKPYSYVAVAAGSKRHNMAKIYSGFYKYNGDTIKRESQQRVPMVCIVKCGTPSESSKSKPGNRGKRDSQVILMSFLQKLIFNERMCELEYQLLKNIWCLTGLMSDFYETVLMVDADTKVYPDSLKHMIAEMCKDPEIMGLCGETKIANKKASWVSAIQVFEYFISHHQSKAFESIFGSVTCLPGCFSMYRIKSPKTHNGYWVPILANPDIVERYSDNVTNTLHKKNLLLLGEDRYLSSLMLKTFPKRKQVFVPKAACKTLVPDEFKVLLSQRRRWINSTIHNLMELVLINDLCGIFCFSMQFVIFIELMGSIILPLAISFTIYIIIYSIVSSPTPVLTLYLLAIILGLPGVLIVITASRLSYLVWMVIYIFALPIWNFVLPVYAFWKFDDFSWGETRTIVQEDFFDENGIVLKTKEVTHGDIDDADTGFDYSKITLKLWRDFA